MSNGIVDLKTFANRLTFLIESTDETTYTLANKLGLSPATISRYANALMKPKMPTVISLANIFNVSASWLMGYDVPMSNSENESSADFNHAYNNLTESQQALFDFIRQLDEEGTRLATRIIHSLLDDKE